MSPATRRLALIDPLTLRSRELLRLIESADEPISEWLFVHSDLDDEHQIAEIGGEPSLAPPLAAVEDLEGCDTVVVGSELDSSRLEVLEQYLADNPDVALLDMSRLERFVPLTEPATGLGGHDQPAARVRLAHPSLVTARLLLEAFAPFRPAALTIAAFEPVSTMGREAVEIVARQAAQRLQGAEVGQRVRDLILAFNLVVEPGGAFDEEAAQVFSGLPVAVTRSLSGCFHGHATHIGIVLEDELDEVELHDAWQSDPRIEVWEPPLSLDAVVENDQVLVTPPSCGFDRRVVAVQAAVDGLRVGGARTALEILRNMV
jgi:aspartate-semialdehyde dehydrogenase